MARRKKKKTTKRRSTRRSGVSVIAKGKLSGLGNMEVTSMCTKKRVKGKMVTSCTKVPFKMILDGKTQISISSKSKIRDMAKKNGSTPAAASKPKPKYTKARSGRRMSTAAVKKGMPAWTKQAVAMAIGNNKKNPGKGDANICRQIANGKVVKKTVYSMMKLTDAKCKKALS